MQSDNATSSSAPTITHSLPNEGFVRLTSILAPLGPIPVGSSTWWAGVKIGRFPQPVDDRASTLLNVDFKEVRET